MDNTPLHYQTITALARSIRAGELSPVEITERLFSRLESLDGNLNAFKFMCRERAFAEARAAEMALRAGQDLGPLHGIPYVAKDLFDVRGLPTCAGTGLLENNIALEDAHVIKSLSRAGMILLGKTHTVQFAYGGVGINHDCGTPHNPWRRDPHVPGGSSSGSAVAVAAGLTPAALGSDTGGSVRIPAALCGITGLKSTVGRIGRSGVYPLSWSLDSVGPLTRSVEDAAIMYRCMQGIDSNDDTTWHHSEHDVFEDLKLGARGLRLAFAETVFWEDVHPEVEKAVWETAKVFENMGARVESVELAAAGDAFELNRQGLIIAAEAYTLNKELLEEHFDRLDPIVANRMIRGKIISAAEYLQNILDWKALRVKANASMRDVDVVLVPTTAIPAKPVAEAEASFEAYSEINLAYLRNTAVGNILNLCGLSVPCGFTTDGLPIGLMLYGKSFQENKVLRAGYAFQRETDWHTRVPDLGWAEK